MFGTFDFNDSPLFTPVTHPQSGVTVHVLTHRVAPAQQGFYFVNDESTTHRLTRHRFAP